MAILLLTTFSVSIYPGCIYIRVLHVFIFDCPSLSTNTCMTMQLSALCQKYLLLLPCWRKWLLLLLDVIIFCMCIALNFVMINAKNKLNDGSTQINHLVICMTKFWSCYVLV